MNKTRMLMVDDDDDDDDDGASNAATINRVLTAKYRKDRNLVVIVTYPLHPESKKQNPEP